MNADDLLANWKSVYQSLIGNPLNVDEGIARGYLACLGVCIQQLEELLESEND